MNLNDKNNIQNREMILNSTVEIRDAAETDASKKIVLRIELDSWSDWYIYKSESYQYSEREKIGKNAFDESLSEIESGKRTLFAFADHDQDIKNILGSSKDENSKVYKDGNTIFFEFEVKKDDAIANKTFDLIKNGSITANSFIFRMKKSEKNEKTINENGIQKYSIERTVTEGELISIDPVVNAYYKQNYMQARDSDIKENAENHAQKLENETQKRRSLMDLKNKIKNLLVELKRENEFSNYENETNETTLMTAFAELNADVMVQRTNIKLDETARNAAIDAVKAKGEATLEELRNAKITETENEIKTLRAEVEKNNAKKSFDENEIRQAFLTGKYAARKDKSEFKSNLKVLNEKYSERSGLGIDDMTPTILEKYTGKNAFKNLDNLRAFTGQDNDHGALIIPIIESGLAITDYKLAFPELAKVSRVIGIIGEAKTQIDIELPYAATEPDYLDKGEASTEVDGNATRVYMEPKILSQHFKFNSRMQAHWDFNTIMTRNVENGHISKWRKSFVANLFGHIAVTFPSIKDSYTGGMTAEAVVTTEVSGKISLNEILKLLTGRVEKFGPIILQGSFWYMHPDVFTDVIWPLFQASKEDVTLAGKIDITPGQESLFGIPVVLNSHITNHATFPLSLLPADGLVVYGGIEIIRDSDQFAWANRMDARQITTLGEMKLVDPMYASRTFKYKV